MKRNEKGFTLIELLAVIVILAIISMITMPNVLSMINYSRQGSAETSMTNYVRAVEQTLMVKMMNPSSYFGYDDKYLVEDTTLTTVDENEVKEKRCINKETKEKEDGLLENGSCDSKTQNINPSYMTFSVKIKGIYPDNYVGNIIVIKGDSITKAHLKINNYYVSYYYGDDGKVKVCSDESRFLEENEC